MYRTALLLSVLLFVSGLFFSEPLFVRAQTGSSLSNLDGSSLVMSPRYPEPDESVRIELNDYSLNTSGASFTWFLNGAEIVSAKNERAVVITAGEIGTTQTVRVVTKLASGATTETTVAINPIRVDLLVEAETLVPGFYSGRAIPSSGSITRVTAIPFTGANRTPESYSYLWRVGEDVVSGGSRFGKNSTAFRSGFERSVEVSVDIIDTNGSVIASESMNVPISNPELYFYEMNPLEGQNTTAITKDYIFVSDEVAIRAEPYFVDTTLMNQNPLVEWKLNSRTISNQSNDAQEITLRKEGNQGSFELEFHVRNLQQLLQGVKDSITINF